MKKGSTNAVLPALRKSSGNLKALPLAISLHLCYHKCWKADCKGYFRVAHLVVAIIVQRININTLSILHLIVKKMGAVSIFDAANLEGAFCGKYQEGNRESLRQYEKVLVIKAEDAMLLAEKAHPQATWHHHGLLYCGRWNDGYGDEYLGETQRRGVYACTGASDSRK